MRLPWKVRVLFSLQGLLTRVGLFPSGEKLFTMPHDKRMAMSAPKGLLGRVPDVATEDHRVTTRDGGSIRVRLYRAPGATDQPLLYVHGGGFAAGGLGSCDHICRRLAEQTRAVVCSVEYRLAPDHPFPVPLHDVLDAADWFLDRGVDPARLVVAGDSAGGNLAAVLAIVFRDEGRPLAGQVLIYPAVDLSVSLPGIHAYQGVGLTADDCRLCAKEYLQGHDSTDPLASPWYAAPEGLAPAFVLTVAHDCLQHEGIAYADKLRAAGVPVTHLDLPDHSHGSLSLPKLFRGVDDLYDDMSAFVKECAVRTRGH